MDLSKLRLRPQEQRMLEDMGLNTVEMIAPCWRDELGLGKRRGDDIITRARKLLAYERIKAINISGNAITVILSDTSKSTVVSVEHVLGLWGDDLNRVTEDDRLIIYSPEVKPCSCCGAEPTCICRICQASLCQECHSRHEHDYYQTVEMRYLVDMFQRIREKAQGFSPMPPEKRIDVDLSPSREVVSIAQDKGFSGFAEGFFAELYGNELMKKALACALFSTPEEPVHVLIVGDPAGGKTLARDIIARRMGSDIELVGANATRAGLVCNLATEELGVLASAKGKIVLADEFDKIPDQDVEYCYELLSNGKCSVHSARVHDTIESHFIMVAFANPVNTVFVKEPIKEIGLPPILLSRFALIVKAGELDANHRMELLKKKLLGDAATHDFSTRYLSWLRESRKHSPKFMATDAEIDSYVARVNSLVEQYLGSPLRRDLRMGDYAKRVATAIASANFSDVDGKVLEEAAKLMEACIEAWQV